MPDFSSADAAKIKAWKAQKHLGSPTSILFFTQEQLQLWDEKKIIFVADYSTGSCFLIFLKKHCSDEEVVCDHAQEKQRC